MLMKSTLVLNNLKGLLGNAHPPQEKHNNCHEHANRTINICFCHTAWWSLVRHFETLGNKNKQLHKIVNLNSLKVLLILLCTSQTVYFNFGTDDDLTQNWKPLNIWMMTTMTTTEKGEKILTTLLYSVFHTVPVKTHTLKHTHGKGQRGWVKQKIIILGAYFYFSYI